ncbi:MAG: DNA translocase FtsK, partial [Clostridia bacterium]|nr:DNA translocase FtsK [Clostridia bacterium]
MKSAKKQAKNDNGLFSKESVGIALILFSVISAVLMLLSDAWFVRQWFYTQFLYGVFGYFAFALFAALCYFGIILLSAVKKRKGNAKKSFLIFVFLFFLICLAHTVTANDAETGYSSYITDCYNRGVNGMESSTGGGALFAVFVYPAVKFLTPVGCYVLFSVLMITDIIVFVRISVNAKAALRRRKGKPKEFAGYKMYPDESFDFKAAPASAPKSRLYDRAENDASPRQNGKKADRTERDKALTILYPQKQSGASATFGTGYDFNGSAAANRTDDFSGGSYQRQMDRDHTQSSNFVRRGSVEPGDRYETPDFGNRARVSERRIFGAGYTDRSVSEETTDGGRERFAAERPTESVERRRVDLFDNGNRSDAEDDSVYFRTEEKRKLEIERENASRAKENDSERSRARTIFTGKNGGKRDTDADNGSDVDDVKIYDSLSPDGAVDNSPFAEKWDKRFGKSAETDNNGVKPDAGTKDAGAKEDIGEIRPSAVKKFGLEQEKKAIYIEPDTGDAVMPEEEKPNAKSSDGEQMQLVENNEYIGIPEMPLHYKYKKPPIDLYKDNPKKLEGGDEKVEERIAIIEKTLDNFGIPARVENVVSGPTITRYELSIPENITVSKVPGKASDLAMRLAVESVRIEAPIPGKNLVGIEVPNKTKDLVGMKELLLEKDYQKSPPEALSIILGEDVVGNPIITDLTKTPHLLVAGATGMGKSVFLNAMIMSLITKYGPEDLRLILVDPKQVEFTIYEHLPHLLIDQIITEAQLCIGILDWAIDEMEMRYKIFRSCFAQKIDEYNNSINPKTQRKMPKIVIIIDELGDLFSISSQVKQDIENRIRRLTQKARAAGIHVVVATQRPDVTVITGVIKTNLPSRVAFKVLNFVDSKT